MNYPTKLHKIFFFNQSFCKIKISSIFVPAILAFAEVAQLVEHNLAKVRVAGSSPVFRSQ